MAVEDGWTDARIGVELINKERMRFGLVLDAGEGRTRGLKNGPWRFSFLV